MFRTTLEVSSKVLLGIIAGFAVPLGLMTIGYVIKEIFHVGY